MAFDNTATLDSIRQQKPGGVITLRFEGNGTWFEVVGKRTPHSMWVAEIQMGDGRKMTKDQVTDAQAEQHFLDLCLALHVAWLGP
jgi:frataxin-like iron-binding protein CyaY